EKNCLDTEKTSFIRFPVFTGRSAPTVYFPRSEYSCLRAYRSARRWHPHASHAARLEQSDAGMLRSLDSGRQVLRVFKHQELCQQCLDAEREAQVLEQGFARAGTTYHGTLAIQPCASQQGRKEAVCRWCPTAGGASPLRR